MATPSPRGQCTARGRMLFSHLRILPLSRSTPGSGLGHASASFPRRGSYRQIGILEREVMLRSLLVGDKTLLVEPKVAWVAPKVIMRVVLLGGPGGLNVLTTK